MKNSLLIFYRNPELGKVKTRLAATIGEAHALAIYLKLVQHTRTVAEAFSGDRIVFYSDYIDREDSWNSTDFRKKIQEGKDLGERMKNAFASQFLMGEKKVCIIGTDCPDLNDSILKNAFNELERNDVVIGPAGDGGYYLLGMKQLHPELFENKNWSTDTVAADTIKNCQKLHLTISKLSVLNDVDVEADLPPGYFSW